MTVYETGAADRKNDITAIAITKPHDRPEHLQGITYKIKTPNAAGQIINIYLTVNEHDGEPFEVFLNCTDSSINELASVSMVLISRLLRLGVPLDVISEDLEQVHSAHTAHMAGKQWCPSLIARIGRVLKEHEAQRKKQFNLDNNYASA